MKNLFPFSQILFLNLLLFGSIMSFAQTDPPENLFVTPIGAASWDSITSNDFQFYKVFLNGVFITDTDSIAYQYGNNGEELISGESYLAEISAFYNDGLSETVSFEFVYLPCDSFPSHSGVNAYEENNQLYFYWDQVEDELGNIFIGTNFYFEGELMDFIPSSDTFYIYPSPGPGFYTYCFHRVYSNDGGQHYWESCIDNACLVDAGYPPEFNPPRNLEVVDNTLFQNPTICWLEWDEPNGFYPVWLQYDDGVNVNGFGVTGEFSYAVKWDPSQLEGFDGTQISKINFFPKESGSNFTFKIWKGENAAILLFEQELIDLTFDAWNEINLNSTIPIDPNEQLWVGFDVTSSGYPAGFGNFVGSPNSNLISIDGINWEHLSDYGLSYSWNLAIYVEATKSSNKSNNLLGYLVYREGEYISDTIQELSFVDTIPEYNYHACYEVSAVYEMGISDPSNEACAIIIPAIFEDQQLFSIHPNPTQNQCKIASETPISSLRIYNHLGQICKSIEQINALDYQLNLSDLENGIYIIEVESKTRIQKTKLIIEK